MIALDVADLVVIASRMLGLDTGQVLDLLDVAAAERALAQARPGSKAGGPGSEAGGPGSEAGAAAGRAAALLQALVRERPFRRGNQQVALAAMLQFLAVNGWNADPDPPGPVREMVARLAAGPVDLQDVTDWLAPRLRPIGRPAKRAQEAPPMPSRLSPLAEKIKMATMRTQPKGMFTRFTEQARRAVHLAQEEARLLRHGYVSPEHLLLGLLYEGEGVAAKALEALGISWQDARDQVEEITGHGQAPATGHLPFTPQAKKGLELSLREALALGHLSIGTEHLLLGLLRADGSVAVQVLARLGADQARVQEQVLELLHEGEQSRLVELTVSEAGVTELTVSGDLVDAAEQLAQVRQQKEASFDAGDLEAAAALRDREKLLLTDKLRLERQLEAGQVGAGPDVQAVVEENQRIRRELDRLRDLLRQHGIEPDGSTARTA